MVATALVGLVILGGVITWDKQLPRPGERWTAISARRKVLTASGIPVGLAVAAFAATLVAASADADRFYESLTLLIAVLLGAGGLGIAGLTAIKIARLRSNPSGG